MAVSVAGQSLVHPGQPEFPIYVSLKLLHCQRVLRGGATGSITARKVHRAMAGSTKSGPALSELFDVSSYFVRERLKNLNHGTILREREVGRTKLYDWNEALTSGTFQSFRHLAEALSGQVHLSLDVYRTAARFSGTAFNSAQFIQLFKEHRDTLLRRRWYSLATKPGSKSASYSQFLRSRLETMVKLGLAVEVGADQFRVTERGELAAHWLDLLLHSVDYPS